MDHDAQRYLNCLAKLLSLLNDLLRKDNLPVEQLSSIKNYEQIAAETQSQLDHAWESGENPFYEMLESSILTQTDGLAGTLQVKAMAAVLWMDYHISYQQPPPKDNISLYRLLPLRQDKPVSIDKLNDNDQETGIQLHPKFAVCKIFNQQSGAYESFANRDVHEGLNGKLNNVSYVPYQPELAIHNVILPQERDYDTLRIAFCPMSDNHGLLQLDEQIIKWEGIEMSGRAVAALNDREKLLSRFQEDLALACSVQADILFFPEMLGMPELEGDDPETNLTILDHTLKMLELPSLICLPTWWRNGINSATVVYQDGTILGAQKKYIPYVDQKGRWREALRKESEKHYLIVHIPGLHRIAIAICAEFPPLRDHMAKILCGGLGVTLILVPSYSRGEQDFLNSLSTLKDYGVTVVWGNCCGAAKSPRVIGGCSIAGFDKVHRFGSYCKCGETCEGKRACLYLVELPLHLTREKPYEPIGPDPIRHHLL